MRKERIEEFLWDLLRREKVMVHPVKQRRKQRRLSKAELAPVIDALAWHVRTYQNKRPAFGMPRRKPLKSCVTPERYREIRDTPATIGKGNNRRPNPAWQALSDKEWQLWSLAKMQGRGRPKGNSRRDGFLLAILQTLSTPKPWRKGDRLKGLPIFPVDCYGFKRVEPLVKKILRFASPKAHVPPNLRALRKHFIRNLQRQGLLATAQRFLDDTRRNRRLLRPHQQAARDYKYGQEVKEHLASQHSIPSTLPSIH
jgi:hypothetical protein